MFLEYDSQKDGADMALLGQVMSMGKTQCKSFEDTYHAARKVKRLVNEYKWRSA